MVDVSIGNETSPEANWNRRAGRQAGRQTDRQTYVLGGCTSINIPIFRKILRRRVDYKSQMPHHLDSSHLYTYLTPVKTKDAKRIKKNGFVNK